MAAGRAHRRGRPGDGVPRRHRADGRVAAVKVLHRSAWADPSFRVRFRRECDALAHLRHPHVVPVYDFGEDGGCGYLAMPLARGGSLAELLRRGPLAPERGLSRSSPPPPTRWTRPTRPASCTATSRPTTCFSTPTAPGWPTSGSHAATAPPPPRATGSSSARPATWRRRSSRALPPGRPPTATRWRRWPSAALADRPAFEADGVAGLLYAHVHRTPPRASSLRSGFAALRSMRRWRAGSPRIPGRARRRPAPLPRSSGPSHRAAACVTRVLVRPRRARRRRRSWRPAVLLAAGLLAAGGAAAGLTMTLGGGAPASPPAPPAPAPPLSVPGPDGSPVAARPALPADLPGLPVTADSAAAEVGGARVSFTPGGWRELADVEQGLADAGYLIEPYVVDGVTVGREARTRGGPDRPRAGLDPPRAERRGGAAARSSPPACTATPRRATPPPGALRRSRPDPAPRLASGAGSALRAGGRC